MDYTPTTPGKDCCIPKMRTIKELAAIVKKSDPETKLSERAIRTLAKSGELPSVQIGNKYLISLETFEEFLKGNTQRGNVAESICAGIKPVRI